MRFSLSYCLGFALLFVVSDSFGEVKAPTATPNPYKELSQQNNGSLYNTTVEPRSQDLFGKALYRIWIPENVKTIRGIIIRQHGCGPGARKFGLQHSNDLQWQALARKHDCALLGTQLWAPKENCSTWAIPTNGSEYALLEALGRFAEESQHPELKSAPWCLWGHSGGALWVMNMLFRNPERTIAVFPRSGGLTPQREYSSVNRTEDPDGSPEAFKVPVLFCYGEKENIPDSRFYGAYTSTHAIFEPARKQGALWAVAQHPGANHENRNSRLLAVRFFDDMLSTRLGSDSKLNSLDVNSGWLTNLETHEIIKGNASENLKSPKWGWFSNEKLAKDWKQLSSTGDIKDSTPPPAPSSISVSKTGDGIKINWTADADIESGLSEFRVYRDGRLVGTVKGNSSKAWNPKDYFHSWNYSDQPIFSDKKQPEMFFIDKSDSASKTSKYEVSTVNRSDLESSKTIAK